MYSVWYWAITVLLLPLWFKNSALMARLWPENWNVAHKSDHLTASSLALWPPYELWGRSCKLQDLILKLNPYQPLFLHYFSKFYTFFGLGFFFGKFMCAEIRKKFLRRRVRYSLLLTSRVYKKVTQIFIAVATLCQLKSIDHILFYNNMLRTMFEVKL